VQDVEAEDCVIGLEFGFDFGFRRILRMVLEEVVGLRSRNETGDSTYMPKKDLDFSYL
jgi:hypothetical protein